MAPNGVRLFDKTSEDHLGVIRGNKVVVGHGRAFASPGYARLR